MTTNPGMPTPSAEASALEPRRAEVNALLTVGDYRAARQRLQHMPPSPWRDQHLARLRPDRVALMVCGISLLFGISVLWAVL